MEAEQNGKRIVVTIGAYRIDVQGSFGNYQQNGEEDRQEEWSAENRAEEDGAEEVHAKEEGRRESQGEGSGAENASDD